MNRTRGSLLLRFFPYRSVGLCLNSALSYLPGLPSRSAHQPGRPIVMTESQRDGRVRRGIRATSCNSPSPITAEYQTGRPVPIRMRLEPDPDPKREPDLTAPARSERFRVASCNRWRRGKITASSKPSTIEPSEESFTYPGPDTLARTKRLLLAALKVWELKQGLRD